MTNQTPPHSNLSDRLAAIEQSIAIIKIENGYRDEKLKSIYSLGRHLLLAVISLFAATVFAFLVSGGFRIPPAA